MFVADSLLDRLFQAIALLYLMEFLIKFTSGQFLHLILIIMGRQNLHNYVQERNRWTFDRGHAMGVAVKVCGASFIYQKTNCPSSRLTHLVDLIVPTLG